MYQNLVFIIFAVVMALSLLAVFKAAFSPFTRHRGLRFGYKVNNAFSAQGSIVEVSVDGGTTYTAISQITDIPDPSGEASDIDVTNLDSTAKEYITGLLDSQSVNIQGQRVSTDAGQNVLRDNAGAVSPASFRITLSDGAIATFDAIIKKFGVTGAVDQAAMFTCAIRASGPVTWTGTGATT